MYLSKQSYSLQFVIPLLLAYGTRGEGGRQGNQAVKQEQSTTDKETSKPLCTNWFGSDTATAEKARSGTHDINRDRAAA